jgi:hypothetical protein
MFTNLSTPYIRLHKKRSSFELLPHEEEQRDIAKLRGAVWQLFIQNDPVREHTSRTDRE